MPAVFNCNVDGVQVDDSGPGPLQTGAILTDLGGAAFAKTVFNFPAAASREMLAIALFAINNNLQVSAGLDVAANQCVSLSMLAA
jgi:hypothetical protein